MTLLEAIQSRHSVRKYIDTPIEENLVRILQDKVNEVNEKGNLHIQLVINEPKAFKGKYVSPHGDGVHRVKAERGFSLIGYTKMDLGIAKYHFEIGAGKENFEWV